MIVDILVDIFIYYLADSIFTTTNYSEFVKLFLQIAIHSILSCQCKKDIMPVNNDVDGTIQLFIVQSYTIIKNIQQSPVPHLCHISVTSCFEL